MEKIIEFFKSKGFVPPSIESDGAIHRFSRRKKIGDECWYVVFQNNFTKGKVIYCGVVGDWSTGEKCLFNPLHHLTDSQRIKCEKQIREAIKRAQTERAEECNRVAKAADKIIERMSHAESTPYSLRKGIALPADIRITKSGGTLAVPMKDSSGHLRGLQFINPDGTKRFLTGQQVKDCAYKFGGTDDTVFFVCEGFATGATIHAATGSNVFCAFTHSNLKNIATPLRKRYPSASILIAADDDYATEGNPGITSAKTAAAESSCSWLAPVFKESEARGTDFNDLHAREGIEEVTRQIKRKLSALEQDETTAVRHPFSLTKSGVQICRKDKEGTIDWHPVCSPLAVAAYTRSTANENWGRLLKFEDLDGITHHYAMPMSLIAGDCNVVLEHLLQGGLIIDQENPKASKQVIYYISSCQPKKRLRCVDQVGWADAANASYVLPDKIYGDSEVIYQSKTPGEHSFTCKGSLAQWQQEIARLAEGNSLLGFSLAVAFAPPLLKLIGSESGGFHISGPSSKGKTTLLLCAGSAWGGGGAKGYIKQWRATSNGLEGIASHHCDALLCLDEISQVDGKEAAEVAYMLANGSGKNRANRDGLPRKPSEWRTLFLSTGEIDLATKITENGSGLTVRTGHEVRVIDIPLSENLTKYGVFNNLHQFADGEVLSRHLKASVEQYYGTPIDAFLTELCRSDFTFIHDFIKEQSAKFISSLSLEQLEGSQNRRVANRFALAGAAGELATSFGVLPWETGFSLSCAKDCFLAWRGERTGNEGEEAKLLEQIRYILQTSGDHRFSVYDPSYEPGNVKDRIGFKYLKDGVLIFLIYSGPFKKDLCKGFNFKWAKATLGKLGLLLPGDPNRQTKKFRLKSIDKSISFYQISAEILEGGRHE